MGCAASKASKVVAPMPTDVNGNFVVPLPEGSTTITTELEKKSKGNVIQVMESEGTFNRSQCSLHSTSDSGRSNRESSAKSTRTTDSGLGELEDDPNIVTEKSTPEEKEQASLDERPPTPELSIEGTTISRRKSSKGKRVAFSDKQEEVRNRVNALSPLGGVTERPQSRGGMAFDVMLCPETGNVKRRPPHLRKLEKRRKKGTRRTKEEIEEKLRTANYRREQELSRKQHKQQLIENAQVLITRERQEKAALDDFAQRQMSNTELVASN